MCSMSAKLISFLIVIGFLFKKYLLVWKLNNYWILNETFRGKSEIKKYQNKPNININFNTMLFKFVQ